MLMMGGDDERARDIRGLPPFAGVYEALQGDVGRGGGAGGSHNGLEVAGPYLMGRAIDEYIAFNDLSGLLQITLLLAGCMWLWH